MRSVVVLPQPEGPSIVKNSPSRIVNETSSTAQKSPNILVTASMTMPSARSSFPIRRYDKRNAGGWKAPVPAGSRFAGRASLHRMARPSVAQARRPQILEAAMRAIVEHGFDAVRYVDVAEEAGVAVGTVQHYYASRDAAARRRVPGGQPGGRRATPARSPSPAAATRGAASTLIVEEFTRLDRWGLWLEFWAAARRRDELRAVLEAAYGAWREPIVEAIRRAWRRACSRRGSRRARSRARSSR